MNCSGVISGYSVFPQIKCLHVKFFNFFEDLINKVLGIILPVQISVFFGVPFLGYTAVDGIDQLHLNSDLNYLHTIKLIEN